MTTYTGETIDMTPTPEGFVNIAATFAQCLIGDVIKRRKTDDREILKSYTDIVFYLGQLSGDAKAAKDIEAIEEADARLADLKRYIF